MLSQLKFRNWSADADFIYMFMMNSSFYTCELLKEICLFP